MRELIARTPCAGVLPLKIGDVLMEEIDPGILTLIAPFDGQQQKVSKVLQMSCGLPYPEPNRAHANDTARVIWFGREMALLVGAPAESDLEAHAAVTDQSDGWATVAISGKGVEDVLARLVPLDLRVDAFGLGETRRTLVGQVTASITRIAPDSILILVFRSMAETLVAEVQEVMETLTYRS